MNGRTPHSVKDVMTHTVVAVGLDARFKEVVAAMNRWQVTAVPVLEGEGRVVGVISEGDLLMKEEVRDEDATMAGRSGRLADYAKAGAVTARDLMSSPAVTISASSSLPEAAHLMAHRRIKRLPVVDERGVLKGIVSRIDLLKVFLRKDEELADEVKQEVIERLFPVSHRSISVKVAQGRVTINGTVRDASLIPVAERLASAVEGVVDVHCDLQGPTVAATT
ncbi:CBS domain-containing protein [Streptomyces sp. NPDC057428]|uniref:CBS domain-containing protein n=1 Tax=Streptomyces sp. NPDC057428 TaxID=3346129 RepID=UPI0036C6FBC2